MTGAAALLGLLFAGLAAQGLRPAVLWVPAFLGVWALAAAHRGRLDLRAVGPWLPWLGWAALSAAASGQPLKSLPVLARWSAAVAFFGLACALWRPRHRRWWLWGLCACAPVFGAAALLTGLKELIAHGSGEAMTGLLPPYYNYTAFLEASAGAAAVAALCHPQAPRGRWRVAVWAVVAVAVMVLVLARARAALLALLAGAAVGVLRQGRAWRLLTVVAVVLGSAGAFTAVVVAQRKGAAAHMLKLDKGQVFKRPQLWKAGLEVAADHPLWGEGPGQFAQGFLRHNFASRYRVTNYQFSTAYAHSEPLQLAAETGFVGLALWLLAFVLSARSAVKGGGALEGEAALAAAAAMSLQCLLDNMLQVPALALLFFSALACAVPAPVSGPAPSVKAAASPAAPLWTAFAAVGVLLSAAAWVPGWLAASWAAEQGPPPRRLEALRKAAAVYPQDAALHGELGQAWLGQWPPRPAEALAEFERASELSPTNALFIVWRAELLRAAGRWAQAEALARQAAALEPNFLQARLLLAEAAARSGRREEAAEGLAEVLRRRAALEEAGVYIPNRALYVGYDLVVCSFDEGRFKAVKAQVSHR